VLIDACSQSLPDRGCRLGSAATGEGRRPEAPGGEASGVAIVRRRGELGYVIELGIRQRGESRWVVRELSFKPDDPPAERWRAVGLVIGTLVGEAEVSKTAEHAAPPAARSRPPELPSPHRPEHSRPGFWLGLDALAGPALDDGTWRFGGGLRTEYRPARIGPIGVASARYELRPRSDSGVGVDWMSASLGAGVTAGLGEAVSAETSVSMVIERIHADVEDPESGATDDGSRWVLGGRLEAGAIAFVSPRLGFWAGGSLGLPASSTRILLRDRPLGLVPSPSFGLAFGLRAGLF